MTQLPLRRAAGSSGSTIAKTALLAALWAALLAAPFASLARLDAQTREQQLLRQPPVIAGVPVIDPAERLQLATANSEYPVTPGDMYRITYLRAGALVETEAVVENDYTVNLNIFGRVDAGGMTFTELRREIILIVERSIPRSLPAVSMISVGVFQVRVTGQIAQSRSVTAWGMTRVSDVVREHLTAYSSIRRIAIVSHTGESEAYDLFRALDLGDQSQDPYVRPGDTVRIERAARVVYIGGEVNQPGRLELALDESVREIKQYARGTTLNADLSRVRVTRSVGRGVRTYFVDLSDDDSDFALRDGDVILVPSRLSQRPVVYVEGLVTAPPELETTAPPPVIPGVPAAAPPPHNRVVVPIGVGDTLYGVLTQMQPGISPRADLSRAQVLRAGETLPLMVSLEQLLYDFEPEYDIELQPFDRIVIPRDPNTPPEGEPSVLITGGVNAPGRYPVLVGMDAYTHIRLAGGFDRELNSSERYRVYDAEGTPKPSDAPIEAGDHIEVARNSFVYNFNRYFPIIATGVGFVATIVATLTLFGL